MNLKPLKRENLSLYLSTKFVNFASYDNLRKIASIIDGNKNASRKALYTAIEYNINNEIKVSQLGSKVAEFSQYLHGNLDNVIVNMAKSYVGTNNLPLLYPEGNFGTRLMPEASASRYIFTHKQKYLDLLFRKEYNSVLTKQYFEGELIEPVHYVPVLPLVLINGTVGVSSGYAQKVFNRSVEDVIRYIKLYFSDDNVNLILSPNIKGFSGTCHQGDNNKQWLFKGRIQRTAVNKVLITEVPFNYSLKDYIVELDKLEEKGFIKSYTDMSDSKFMFEVVFESKILKELTDDDLLDKLSLVYKDTENYTFINENNKIVVYDNIEDVINHYIKIKLEYTQKRLEHQINELKSELKVNTSKAFFIMSVIKGDIVLMNKKKDEVINQIKTFEKIIEVDGNYNYILSMPLYNLTQEKFNELKEKIKSTKEEIKELEQKDPKEVWLSEIEELEKYLKKNGY